MSEIINVVRKDTAEKVTTNRNSLTKHIDIHMMRNRQIVIEACEDHKYCYWLSKQMLDDVAVNADILDVTMYEQYDYVAYAYKLYYLLHLNYERVYEGTKVSIQKAKDEPGIRYRAPWGADSMARSNAENGMFMAHGLVEYYDRMLALCQEAERDPMILNHFDQIEIALDRLTGDTMKDYANTRKLLEPMWKWEHFRLAENENFANRYARLRCSLDQIYNAHMTIVR